MKTQKRESVVYRIVDAPSKTGKLEDLKYWKAKGKRPTRYIEIAKWKNWDHSYWIRFVQDKNSLIIDSNIIDELYDILHSYHLLMALD